MELAALYSFPRFALAALLVAVNSIHTMTEGTSCPNGFVKKNDFLFIRVIIIPFIKFGLEIRVLRLRLTQHRRIGVHIQCLASPLGPSLLRSRDVSLNMTVLRASDQFPALT